jgi:uncharacterized caspase-like protein
MTIQGQATDDSVVTDVMLNGKKVQLEANGHFATQVALKVGSNPMVITARDSYGNTAQKTFTIDRVARTSSPRVGTSRRRIALVIGNAAYQGGGALRNPVNDAADIAETLRHLGFQVTLLQDASRQQIEDAVTAWSRALRQGGVGLFYYTGHGVQVEGENYLIPVEARLDEATDVKYKTVPAGWILERMQDAGNELNMLVLDACRNNPFARSWQRSTQRGLAVMEAARSSLIAYATAPGKTAEDGRGRNSPYTENFLRYMKVPNLAVEEMFKRIRVAVIEATGGKQIPWEASSLTGSFSFAEQ